MNGNSMSTVISSPAGDLNALKIIIIVQFSAFHNVYYHFKGIQTQKASFPK